MYPAFEYRYKFLDDVRVLGPPHQRFPHMHPEKRLWPIENEVYLEFKVPLGLSLRILWIAMAGVCFLGWLGLPIYGGLAIIIDPLGLSFLGLTALFALLTLLTKHRSYYPILLYRPTQEMIYCINGKVHRQPWAQTQVRIDKSFNIRGAYSNYILQFGFGKDPNQPTSYISVGGGARYEEEALRDWEYYCRYMESGHVQVRETPESEKTAGRKSWEENDESLFIKLVGLIVAPIGWAIVLLWDRSFFKHKDEHPWPQEVIDMCENHPLLRGKKPD